MMLNLQAKCGTAREPETQTQSSHPERRLAPEPKEAKSQSQSLVGIILGGSHKSPSKDS